MKALEAIHQFFGRKDSISPDGGRPVTTTELIEFTLWDTFAPSNPGGGTRELAEMCATELGVTLDS